MNMVHDFLTSMYTNRADFVFTVSRDFVRSIKTPLLIAPDDVPAHPYKVAMEVASLAPKAEVTIYPWKDSPEHIDEVVEHARRFLKAQDPSQPGVKAASSGYPWLRMRSDRSYSWIASVAAGCSSLGSCAFGKVTASFAFPGSLAAAPPCR